MADKCDTIVLHVSVRYDGHKLHALVQRAENVPTSLVGRPQDTFIRLLLIRDLKRGGWIRRRRSFVSMEARL